MYFYYSITNGCLQTSFVLVLFASVEMLASCRGFQETIDSLEISKRHACDVTNVF